MKTFLSFSVLGIALSSFSVTVLADQGSSHTSHIKDMGQTAVEHHRMKTEDASPDSNAWLMKPSDHDARHATTYQSANKVEHTAVQHKRMKTEDVVPESNDWVINKSTRKHTISSGSHASDMGHTAYQHKRWETENTSPSDLDWVVSR